MVEGSQGDLRDINTITKQVPIGLNKYEDSTIYPQYIHNVSTIYPQYIYGLEQKG